MYFDEICLKDAYIKLRQFKHYLAFESVIKDT